MLARNYICCIIIVAISIPSTLEQERFEIPEDGKPRVWNGTRTIPHSRPYMVQIFRTSSSRNPVFGAILNAHTILTSASYARGSVFKIVAGKHLFEDYEPTQQTRHICTTSAHPNTGGNVTTGFIYRYVLLHLSDPFVLNEYVNAIRMAPPGFKPEGDCRIVGWGSTVPFVDRYEILNEAVVKFANPTTCLYNHPTKICILPIGPFAQLEPVICQRDSKIYLYGIQSSVEGIVGVLPDHGYLSVVPELPRDWLLEEVQKAEELCGKSYY